LLAEELLVVISLTLWNLAGRGSPYSSACYLKFQRYRFLPTEDPAFLKVVDLN
jgi:hypothetical protein